MVVETVCKMPVCWVSSRCWTTPSHITSEGLAEGMRNTISILLFGSTHSPARSRTPVDPMSSVYPMSQRLEPTRRNSTGIFRANRRSTAVRMPPDPALENRPKVLCGGADELMVDGEQRQFQPVRNANLIEDVPEMVFHGLLADGELPRNFAVRKTGHNRRYHIQFARRESERL